MYCTPVRSPGAARTLARIAGLTLAVALALGGCTDDPLPLRAVEVTAVSPRNVRITWSTAADAEVRIERSDPDGGFVEVARKPGDHARFLDLGLTPEVRYRYRLTACRAAVCGAAVTRAATTPASRLPPFEITVPAADPGEDVVLFQLSRASFDAGTEGFGLAMDRSGHILWEYETVGAMELEPLADHSIVISPLGILTRIDLDGTELYSHGGNVVHHDVDVTGDGRYIFLDYDIFEDAPGHSLLGDAIRILDPASETLTWEWLGRDYIPTTDVDSRDIGINFLGLGYDWTHANALIFDEAAGAIYLNVRNLNRFYKIAYPSGAVEWIMGDGGDFGAGLWDHSHDPQLLSDHRLLVFDNGTWRPEKYSRVIEVEFDAEQRTAEIVWEYRETPDFYSFAYGSAELQPSGTVLVADGFNGRLLEVTREKQKVWELRFEQGFVIYKVAAVPRAFFTDW